MTVSLKHTFQSAKSDSSDVTIVQPSNWNEEHVLTAAAGKVLGRDTSGNGVVQELPISVTPAGDVTIPNNFTVTGTTTLTTALAAASGGTGLSSPSTAGNVLTSTGTGWASSAIPPSPVQYPQNIQSANYTLVLGDAGKQIFHPASDATVRTYTIPANASVAFPIGTVVLFTVENGGTTVGVAINSDTLVFGNGTTGALAVVASQTLMAIKVTATKWMANYLYQTGTPVAFNTGSSIAVAHSSTPYITAYPWNAGFGVKYANPATLPAGNGQSVAFNAANNAIAVGIDQSPFIIAYPWSGVGFGTKYTNPATLPPSVCTGVAFSPAGDAVAMSHFVSPFVAAYPWNSSTGFGTKYANPATLPTNNGYGISFSPAGNAVAVTHNTSPFISAYPWNSGTGFGTKFSDPATLPTGLGAAVAFSPAGNAVALGSYATPFIIAYAWSGSGFGAKYTNPATLPPNLGIGVAFNPAATSIAVAHYNTPFISAYPWNSGTGFGTKYTNPATLPAATTYATSVAFNASGDTIAVGYDTTPFVNAYPWNSSTGFGAKYADPATLPTGVGTGVAFTAI
jgi:hypothetical protein